MRDVLTTVCELVGIVSMVTAVLLMAGAPAGLFAAGLALTWIGWSQS